MFLMVTAMTNMVTLLLLMIQHLAIVFLHAPTSSFPAKWTGPFFSPPLNSTLSWTVVLLLILILLLCGPIPNSSCPALWPWPYSSFFFSCTVVIFLLFLLLQLVLLLIHSCTMVLLLLHLEHLGPTPNSSSSARWSCPYFSSTASLSCF